MIAVRIGLVGDKSNEVRAHLAIPRALEWAKREEAGELDLSWLPTDQLERHADSDLERYDAFWVVPGSPYVSLTGALRVIRFARENGCPLLGTCGGFQHVLIEYARAVLGLSEADHVESNPNAALALIDRLPCSLVGARGVIELLPGSSLARYYGALRATEAYHCNFGLNAAYADRFARTPLKISGVDASGAARAVELTGHPFYIATLFQPELSAFEERRHPLIGAFVDAARAAARRV
jgi:CTP synthase (UTP-ammonia lyase)